MQGALGDDSVFSASGQGMTTIMNELFQDQENRELFRKKMNKGINRPKVWKGRLIIGKCLGLMRDKNLFMNMMRNWKL